MREDHNNDIPCTIQSDNTTLLALYLTHHFQLQHRELQLLIGPFPVIRPEHILTDSA